MDLDQEDAVVVWERWSSLWLKWNAAGQGQGGDFGEGGASAGSGLVGDRGRKEGGVVREGSRHQEDPLSCLSLSLSISFCLTHAILSFILLVLDFWLDVSTRWRGAVVNFFFRESKSRYDREGSRQGKAGESIPTSHPYVALRNMERNVFSLLVRLYASTLEHLPHLRARLHDTLYEVDQAGYLG